MFIRGMAETVKAKIRTSAQEGIKPGDIYVTNDAYITGSHLNHFTFTLPIFHKGKLAGFSCCMAHWLDVGGMLGGMTTDIFSEGMQIPIVKYQDRGKVNQDLRRHHPHERAAAGPRAMGDLRAQVTAVKTGERRFLELLDRYGRDEVDGLDRRDHGSRRGRGARAHAAPFPTASTRPSRCMDDDGVDIGKRVPIKVKVIVKGDEMTIDLTDVVEAGARLLQFRHHHRLCLRAGGLQVHHLADRLSDQRRRVPQPQGDHAAGPHRQRDAAGADALVDDASR